MTRSPTLWVALTVATMFGTSACVDDLQRLEPQGLPVSAEHPSLAAWPEWGVFPFEAEGFSVANINHPDAIGVILHDLDTDTWRLLVGEAGRGTWGEAAFDPPLAGGDVAAMDAIMGASNAGLIAVRTTAGELWLYEWVPGEAAVGAKVPLDEALLPLAPITPTPPMSARDLFLDALSDDVLLTFSRPLEDGTAETWMALRRGGTWSQEPVFVPLVNSPSTAGLAVKTLGAFLPDGRPVVGTVHSSTDKPNGAGALLRAKLDDDWYDVAAVGPGRYDLFRDADGRVLLSPSSPRPEPEYSHLFYALYGDGYTRRDVNWERVVRTRGIASVVELDQNAEGEIGAGVFVEGPCGMGFQGQFRTECDSVRSPYWIGDNPTFTGVNLGHGTYSAIGKPVAVDRGGSLNYVPPEELAQIVRVDPPPGSVVPADLEWISIETDLPADVYLDCDHVERLERVSEAVFDNADFVSVSGLLSYDEAYCDDYFDDFNRECLTRDHHFLCPDRDCLEPGYTVFCELFLVTYPGGTADFANYGVSDPGLMLKYEVEGEEPPPRPPVASLHLPDHECHHNSAPGEGWYGSFDAELVALSQGAWVEDIWLEDADGNEVPSTYTLSEMPPVLDHQLYEPPSGAVYSGFTVAWPQGLTPGETYTVRISAENAMLKLPVVEGPGLQFVADEGAMTLSSTPADGATGVAVNVPVLLSFSLDVDAGMVNTNRIRLAGPNGDVAVVLTQLDARTVRVLPASPLTASTTYTVHLDPSFESVGCGRDLDPLGATVTFTTEAP